MHLSGKNPFSPIQLLAKVHLRKLRIEACHDMWTGAELLGISRKSLEDLETHRPYGCYIDWELVVIACDAYDVDPNHFRSPLSKSEIKSLTPSAKSYIHAAAG